MNFLSEPLIKGRTMAYEYYCSKLLEEVCREHDDYSGNEVKWEIRNGVVKKVDNLGQYKEFEGDTIVWPCDEKTIHNCFHLQKKIYSACSDLLAEPLPPDSFHVTIHDLNNVFSCDEDEKMLSEKMEISFRKCQDIFLTLGEYLKNTPDQSFVKLESIGLSTSNMVSFVMKFIPATKKDYKILMNLYNLFENIVYLDYFLRPHISFGYFLPENVGKYGMKEISKLMEYSKEHKIELIMNLNDIVYQRFSSMSAYRTMLSI